MHWLWVKLDTSGALVILPEYKLPSGFQKSQAVHRTLFCFFSFQWKKIHFNGMKQFYNLYYRKKVSFYKLKTQICKIRCTSEEHNSICCIILSNNIYLLSRRWCGISWCWYTSETSYAIHWCSGGRNNCFLHAISSCVSCRSCGQSCSFVDMLCYVHYEAIKLLRTSVLFSM